MTLTFLKNLVESMGCVGRIREESKRNPGGVWEESGRNPGGIREESGKNPGGIREESGRNPGGIHTLVAKCLNQEEFLLPSTFLVPMLMYVVWSLMPKASQRGLRRSLMLIASCTYTIP